MVFDFFKIMYNQKESCVNTTFSANCCVDFFCGYCCKRETNEKEETHEHRTQFNTYLNTEKYAPRHKTKKNGTPCYVDDVIV